MIVLGLAFFGVAAVTGLLGHTAAGHFALRLALPLALGGFLGAQVGSRVSLAVDKRVLKRAFGVLLVLIAVWMVDSVMRGT